MLQIKEFMRLSQSPLLQMIQFVLLSLVFMASIASAGNRLSVQSASAIVIDQLTGNIIYEKNSQKIVPIASVTKLMTAMVLLDSKPLMNKMLTIAAEDVDNFKHSRSRLSVGTSMTVHEMLRLALMSSENRAASALSRNYPGGKRAFINAMNRKALVLGLNHTRFRDPTGLYAENSSSARDLAKMVAAAARYPLIREFTTTQQHYQQVGKRSLVFNNTNPLVKNPKWKIGVSKTGYINEAGKCLVMQSWFEERPTIIVLLNAPGKLTPVGDSQRIKEWLAHNSKSILALKSESGVN